MQRLLAIRRPTTIVLVCVGLAALGVTAAAGGSSGATRDVTTFDVVEKTTAVGFVDSAPADVDSLGDVVVGASDLFDKRDSKIGTAHWSCIRTNPGLLRHCTLTYFLPRGFLTLQGPYRDDGTGTFAITGGTGQYRTAHGWMDLTSTTTPDGQTFVYEERFHVIH
jgi:hypothetical protein